METLLTDIERQRRRRIILLCVAVAGAGFALSLQIALNANFNADVMGLSGEQQGTLEAFRESCGIFALGILWLLGGLAESWIGALALLFLGVGLSCYSLVPTFTWLIVASMVFSQGLHVWMPLPSSMALALARPGQQGKMVGRIQAAAAAGSGLGLLVALVLNQFGMQIRPMYWLAGGASIIAATACALLPAGIKAERQRLVIRRQYALYYLMCFLEGWRKQIFLAFAGFYLVKNYGMPLQTMLILWIITQAIGWFSSPAVGRLIDRVGERPVLIFYYSFMSVCFLGYAFITHKQILTGIYLLDSCFFVFALALTTFIGRRVAPEEKTMTLSMGVAMNHVAAVTMPFLGGLLWKHAGHQWTFIIGAVAAVVSVFVALLVPKREIPQPITRVREDAAIPHKT